jgi:hypothetical protein
MTRSTATQNQRTNAITWQLVTQCMLVHERSQLKLLLPLQGYNLLSQLC